MSTKVKTIAVLMGGMSSEREVSLKTGAAVAKGLKNKGYNVVEIDVAKDLPERLASIRPDVAFIALHGTYGEDGCVQGLLEIMQVPYTHSSFTASAIAMDKEITQGIFKNAGLKVANSTAAEIDEITINFMETPFVVKPVSEGSSVGVYIIRTEDDLKRAKKEWAFGRALVEKYIEGHELSVAVLENPAPKALGVIELRPKQGFYTYENKYTDGKTEHLMPAPLSDNETKTVMNMAETAHKALKCSGVSRSDFRYDGKDFYILELNTHPGMTELSLTPEIANFAGINFENLVEILVKTAKCHNIKGQPSQSAPSNYGREKKTEIVSG